MAYTNDPAHIPRDAVRFLAQDTSTTAPHLSDPEVDFLLAENNANIYMAAALSAGTIAAKLAATHGGSKSVGDLSISGGEMQALRYQDLAKRLTAQASRRSFVPTPISTGRKVADKEAFNEDDSQSQHTFRRGMQDNPEGSLGNDGAGITDTSRAIS